MPARVSPRRLGGHRRLEAGQERRSKEGAHGCGPRSLEKPGGSPEQARKARARRPPGRRSGGATGRRTTLGLQTKLGEGYPIASEASFDAKEGGGGLPPKALQPRNPTPRWTEEAEAVSARGSLGDPRAARAGSPERRSSCTHLHEDYPRRYSRRRGSQPCLNPSRSP